MQRASTSATQDAAKPIRTAASAAKFCYFSDRCDHLRVVVTIGSTHRWKQHLDDEERLIYHKLRVHG
jgi:hypothetical protein